jgi:hypothetical protein
VGLRRFFGKIVEKIASVNHYHLCGELKRARPNTYGTGRVLIKDGD